MRFNTHPPAPPAAPAKMPCMRDMHELVTHHLPEPLVKLVPLAELERRGTELVHERPRFAEEVPLVLAGEAHRRARHRGLVGSRTPAPSTALQGYSHA
jgi:hypothetical protein